MWGKLLRVRGTSTILPRISAVYNFATKQNDVNEWVSCILMLQKDLYIYTL